MFVYSHGSLVLMKLPFYSTEKFPDLKRCDFRLSPVPNAKMPFKITVSLGMKSLFVAHFTEKC